MVAVKSHQAERFVAKADPAVTVLLIYGTDVGLVSERARAAAQSWAALDNPPGEVLRIGDADLDDDRDRLTMEARMMPMFGGRKIIRTNMSQRINANLLKPLAEDSDLAATLIIEGGNLKPTDALRKICEASRHAAAIACFADEDRDLEAVIQQELKKTGLKITPDAEDMLVARLGADRALSRGEIEKLTLYCHGKPEITADDVEAIVGDASEMALDRIIQAAAQGQAARATNELARATSAGESPQGVILSLQRYFFRLHRVLVELNQGRSMPEALKTLRPPLFFKQRDAFTAQLRLWSLDRATRAIALINETTGRARRQSALEAIHAERLLLAVAHLAKADKRA